MRVTVAINSFNYIDFICEAIDSVLSQDYKNVELIVIDDGSTDGTLELLNSRYYGEDILIHEKKNGGQLSTFNVLPDLISGEIVFFLDADDVYKKSYISKVVSMYEKNPQIDFVFTNVEYFFHSGDLEKQVNQFNFEVLKSNVFSTYYNKEWVGSPTSAISMRAKLLRKLLPIPFESDWITRADDCLIWGSSLLESSKLYVNEDLVRYRVHGNNNFFGKEISMNEIILREAAINRFFDFIVKTHDINVESELRMLKEYWYREKSLYNLKGLLKITLKLEKSKLKNKINKFW